MQAMTTVGIIEEEEDSWQTPIKKFLVKEILPEDKKEATRIRIRSTRYTVLDEKLYRKS